MLQQLTQNCETRIKGRKLKKEIGKQLTFAEFSGQGRQRVREEEREAEETMGREGKKRN